MTPLKMPSLPKLKRDLPSLGLGRRSGAEIVGLDIQPGLVAAVKARVNGSVLAERAAALALAPDTIREGEVIDEEGLSAALRELFAENKLSKRVRVGIANQRTVMRTLELPPVTDRKELAAAVRFQAQDQVPMPLNNAVLDFHPLEIVDTPAGPRRRVVLVAAQRDMVEKLLAAVRGAGLTPEGVDLSAFALIRSLHQHAEGQDGRVLYLNVDGLTNLAIADGTVCRFTRVVGGGLESIAGELAERRKISVAEARALLGEVDLSEPAAPTGARAHVEPQPEPEPGHEPEPEAHPTIEHAPQPEPADLADGGTVALSAEDHQAREEAMGYSETIAAAAAAPEHEPEAARTADHTDVRAVLENGIREISGEVRNSLDFHRSQDEGGQVSHIVLSGAALDLRGFAEALQASLGFEVRAGAVGVVDAGPSAVSTNRLSVAAGLACVEAPQ
jgi:type IV pilus assembly protein PilM